jgi:transcriptional regulator with XRE-family HTH domain
MNVPEKNIVGKRLRQTRIKKRLTQDQLSAKLARSGVPIDRAGISKIENGSRCVCDYELKSIAKVLNVGSADLLGG